MALLFTYYSPWYLLIHFLVLFTVLMYPRNFLFQFWRGNLGEACKAFSAQQPKGEITLLIDGKEKSADEAPSEDHLELELRELISSGHSLSMVYFSLGQFLSIFIFLLPNIISFILISFCSSDVFAYFLLHLEDQKHLVFFRFLDTL